MSATPRPLPWKIHQIQMTPSDGLYTFADGGSQTADYAERAINAFDALLAVVREVDDLGKDGQPWVTYTKLIAAMEALDASHPGWREWTP